MKHSLIVPVRMELHLLRVIACVMVVVTHITAEPMTALPFGSGPQRLYFALNSASKICVPLFVFISGALFEHVSARKPDLRTFYRKAARRLVVPYLAWSLLYYFLFVFAGMRPFELHELVRGLLTGSVMYHLYYMLISIQLYLTYPLVRRLIESAGLLPCLIAGAAAAFLTPRLFPAYSYLLVTTYWVFALLGMGIIRLSDPVLKRLPKIAEIALGSLLYLASAAICYLSVSPNFVVPIDRYLTASAIGAAGLYLLSHALMRDDPETGETRGERRNPFALPVLRGLRLRRLSEATDLVYFAHPLVMILVLKFVPANRYAVVFAAQLGSILFLLWPAAMAAKKRRA